MTGSGTNERRNVMCRTVTVFIICIVLVSGVALLPGKRRALAQESVERLIKKGQRLAARGRLDAAAKALRRAIELDPNNPDTCYLLAQVYEFSKLYGLATLYYRAYLHVGTGMVTNADEVKKLIKQLEKKTWRAVTLHIRTIPSQAEIFINGVGVGRGNLDIVLQPQYEYHIKAQLLDYHPAEIKIKPDLGETRNIRLRLKKILYKGTLEFHVTPKGDVEVYVDTKKIGKDVQKITVTEGRHLVCFKKQGYNRWWRFYTVQRNTTTKVEATLYPQDRPEQPCDVMPEGE